MMIIIINPPFSNKKSAHYQLFEQNTYPNPASTIFVCSCTVLIHNSALLLSSHVKGIEAHDIVAITIISTEMRSRFTCPIICPAERTLN
jgi:hypothetical protein